MSIIILYTKKEQYTLEMSIIILYTLVMSIIIPSLKEIGL